MANPLAENTITGTVGELLAQLRLLEYGIQTAPLIKDSGNDLIAIRGRVVKFVQVKSSVNKMTSVNNLPDIYDIVLMVELKIENGYLLDDSRIYYFLYGESFKDRKEFNLQTADMIWR